MLADHPVIWLRRRTLSLDHWTALSRTRGEVRQAERAQPGYALQLRGVAVETLADADVRVVRTAIAVLAALGTADDVGRQAARLERPSRAGAGAQRPRDVGRPDAAVHRA